MAKAWPEVAASPEFQALSPDDRASARDQYFQSVVAPSVQPAELPAVRQQFLAATQPTIKPPTKYEQAALDERAKLQAAGIPTKDGITRQILQGMSFGGGDEVLAGLQTPIEMLTRGVGPGEAYNYAKARENLRLDDTRKATGLLGTGAEIAGAVGSGGTLAKAGVTLAGKGTGLLARTGLFGAEGAGYGAVNGALDGGDTLGERASGAGHGAVVGGLLGAALPSVVAGASKLVSPITSSVRALNNPQGAAESQFARAVQESGKAPGDIGLQVGNAAAAGQPEFTVADALGNAGQRMLSNVARSPGEGRAPVVDFLQNRQAGQGGRVVQALDEGLGTNGQTGAQASRGLMEQASRDAAPLYRQAEAVKPVWSERAQQFFDDPIMQAGMEKGRESQRLEALAQGRPYNPNDTAVTGSEPPGWNPGTSRFQDGGNITSQVPNMQTIDAGKRGLDAMLEPYRNPVTGKLDLDTRGRAIDQVRRAFLSEIDKLNPAFAKARAAYAGPASIDSAIDLGEQAASRGRPADNIGVFNGLGDAQQQGFRHGVADKLQTSIERAAFGADKTRPLTSDAQQGLLGRLSKYQGPLQPGAQDQLGQSLARERTMFETRAQATGGSKTFDNQADSAAAAVDPSVLFSLVHGHPVEAFSHAARSAVNGMTGNTAPVRDALGQLLLMRGGNVTPQIEGLLQRVIAQSARSRGIVNNATTGILSGAGPEDHRISRGLLAASYGR